MSPEATNAIVILTPVIVAVIGAVFAGLRAVAIYYVDLRVHDEQLRKVLEDAINNGLGAVQQAASGATTQMNPVVLPRRTANVPATLVPGVQYVLKHADEAVKRFGVTPEAIAEKLVSRAGLREIDTNIAATASATPGVVPPLAPSAAVTDMPPTDRNRIMVSAGDIR